MHKVCNYGKSTLYMHIRKSLMQHFGEVKDNPVHVQNHTPWLANWQGWL